jgi:hypothetical protein
MSVCYKLCKFARKHFWNISHFFINIAFNLLYIVKNKTLKLKYLLCLLSKAKDSPNQRYSNLSFPHRNSRILSVQHDEEDYHYIPRLPFFCIFCILILCISWCHSLCCFLWTNHQCLKKELKMIIIKIMNNCRKR